MGLNIYKTGHIEHQNGAIKFTNHRSALLLAFLKEVTPLKGVFDRKWNWWWKIYFTKSLQITFKVQFFFLLTWYANLYKHNIKSENGFQGLFKFARNNASSSHKYNVGHTYWLNIMQISVCILVYHSWMQKHYYDYHSSKCQKWICRHRTNNKLQDSLLRLCSVYVPKVFWVVPDKN